MKAILLVLVRFDAMRHVISREPADGHHLTSAYVEHSQRLGDLQVVVQDPGVEGQVTETEETNTNDRSVKQLRRLNKRLITATCMQQMS